MERESVNAGVRLRCILKAGMVREADSETSTIELTERKAGMRLELTEVARESVAVRLDQRCHPAMLQDGRLKSICDYLVLIPDSSKHWAVLVELKKTIRDEVKPLEQLRRSLSVVEYLLSVCAVEYGERLECEVRYLLVGEKDAQRFDKQRTRADPGDFLDRQSYRGITVQTFIGFGLPADALLQ